MAWVEVAALRNGSFDEGFSVRDSDEVQVALYWEPWWRQGTPEQVADGFYKRPEFKPEPKWVGTQPGRVFEGNYGQKFFTTFATHSAGLYQRVRVKPGERLWLKAMAQIYGWNPSSGKDAGYACVVGIDPSGGVDPLASGVVWGPWKGQSAKPKWDGSTWEELEVRDVEALGEWVTVFLRGENLYRAKHADSYWDHVRLLRWVEDSEPPTPPAPPEGMVEELRWIAGLVQEVADKLEAAG